MVKPERPQSEGQAQCEDARARLRGPLQGATQIVELAALPRNGNIVRRSIPSRSSSFCLRDEIAGMPLANIFGIHVGHEALQRIVAQRLKHEKAWLDGTGLFERLDVATSPTDAP